MLVPLVSPLQPLVFCAALINLQNPDNLRFVFQPAAIAYPNTAQDVSAVLKIAQQFNYSVVARSGGVRLFNLSIIQVHHSNLLTALQHSYIANGLGGKDGSVVVDMSNFVQLSVDPNTFIATIGPGNRLGDVALGLNAAGRALPHGTCPYIGIGGHSGMSSINIKTIYLFFPFPMKVMEAMDSRQGSGV